MLSVLSNLLTGKTRPSKFSKRNFRLGVESLENRAMLTAVVMTDYEQLVLELVNRARLDPTGEVARNTAVSDLNQGLSPGSISSAPKQPLASIQPLVDSGELHALDMLEHNFFAHNSLNGDTPTDRAAAQGYSGPVGENIAWNGSTGPIDFTAETITAHNNLFFSASHRLNLMNAPYDHAGIAVEFGQFTHTDGLTYNVPMVAQEFGFNTGGNPYLTGVVYSDTVIADDFFSIGESESGVRITAVDSGGTSYWTHSGPSGGYNLELPAGTYTVTASGGVLDEPIVTSGVVITTDNVKVDFDTSTSPQHAQDIAGFNTGEEFWVGESNGNTLNTAYYGDWPSTNTFDIVGVGDMNGDGLDDVVGRSNDGTLRVSISTGDSSFASSNWGSLTTVTPWSNLFIGDFNGDGLDDLMGRADSDGTFWLAKSDGNSFTNSYWGKFTPSVAWTTMLALDLNGDGKLDISGRAADGTWWSGISTGSALTNSYWGKWSTNVEWSDISVGDFNGDGLDDIAGRGNNAYWWVNESTGTHFATQYWATWTQTVNWEDVSVGDYDGDGLDDIAGRANGQWWIAISTGARGFSNHYWGYWTTNTSWSDVSMIDINADGKDDLIGRAANGQWWVYRSTGSNFTAVLAASWSPGATWTSVTVGNFI